MNQDRRIRAMLSANPHCSRLTIVTLTIGMIAACGIPTGGQEAPAVTVGYTRITGLPDDWSHHRQVFSNPGTEENSIRNGTYDQWLKVVNDPRYVIQQLKRNLPVEGSAAEDVKMRRAEAAEIESTREMSVEELFAKANPVKRARFLKLTIGHDWSMGLGSGGYLQAGQYPAMYSFSTSTAPCSDYVVYPTGLAGSGTQATIVAYTNIYNNSTCTSNGAVPSIAWAYNTVTGGGTGTGGAANLSPVLSSDGTQVAYIQQTSSAAATLVLLKWAESPATITTAKGSVTSSSTSVTATTGITAADVGMQISDTAHTSCIPANDTIAAFSGTTVTLAKATSSGCGIHSGDSLTLTAETVTTPGLPVYVTNSSYRACTAPCYTTLALSGAPTDTNSAPYYRYDNDTMYVGDNSGKLHEFTDVFLGTPAEVTSGWPITVSTNILTSPVYDSGTSGNIFVADSGGYLYSYKASTAVHQMTSSKLTNASNTTGIVDAPMIDSSSEEVYVSVGDDANTSTTGSYTCVVAAGCSGVFQFAANNATIGTGACSASSAKSWGTATNCGEEAIFGTGSYPTMYDGTFDNSYYSAGTGNTGYLWECPPSQTGGTIIGPRLSAAVMQSNGGIVPSGDVVYYTGNTITAIASLTSGASPAPTCSPVTEFYNTGNASAVTTYTASISGTSTPTIVTVASNANIAIGNYIQIDSEIMLVTGTSGSTSITVARAQIGTTEAAHTATGGNITIPAVDYIYLSVTELGNQTPGALACSGACLYSIAVGTASGGYAVAGMAPTNGLAETGGTSGIIIDNSSTITGASQIYFTTLANGSSACAGNGTTGNTVGGCAVQASQLAP
jgi:hypothetical protein